MNPRLTYINENGKPAYKIGDTEYTNEVAERLYAYEKEGLEPYHIRGVLSDCHKLVEQIRTLKKKCHEYEVKYGRI